MRKKIIIILIFFSIIAISYFIYQKQTKMKASACNTNEDCTMLGTEKLAGYCFNKQWQQDLTSVFISGARYNCGLVCSGLEFTAGGKRMPKNNCECINNRCQIVNLSNYPGCSVGCD